MFKFIAAPVLSIVGISLLLGVTPSVVFYVVGGILAALLLVALGAILGAAAFVIAEEEAVHG